ncbi:structural maintenance of chromosomes protein 6 [Anoplophora glabripennis]|uniref:structural maintenance of chromosomes protein 6 n=1 Tax=Anoplophora glabripennis TaxID=217634 RepID=UPI000874997D|nr:structural maintenance of chromosomes protein 6 [Anoplophora glabripennis]
MSNRKRKPLSQLSVDEEANASTSRKKSRIPEDEDNNNSQKRAGTIMYMILKNFMCHSLLEVNFTNNISIVIGKNGSGKSAILTALVVGLGGKASLTNRGSSVKGFVKVGKSSGSIEIELYNEGPMAYRPNVYGKRITIIRNLSANGSGSYRIRSEKGEIISTQSREVQNITISLNIQVDNPICILNQDTSRNFLSSNDPKNKFTLFMRATKLETLESEYKKIETNKTKSIQTMTEKENSFRKLQDEIKRLKRKIEGHKTIISLKDKKSNLHRELVWAKVRDSEEELEQVTSKVNDLERKWNESKSNSDKQMDRVAKLKNKILELEQQIHEVKDQIRVQTMPQNDIRRQLEELSRKYNDKKREKQQIQTTIDAKANDIKSLEEDISSSNENMTKVEQQKIQRMKQLEALQNKQKGIDDHLETIKNDLFQIKGHLSQKEEEEQTLRQEIQQIDHRIAGEKENLNAVKQESGNNLLLYGRNMPRVKQMIEQYKGRFEHEPRGPLGSYIKLKDKKWAVAVEGYLGTGTLSAFAVDNNRDSKLLREIFNKVWSDGRQPQIITSKFIYRKHDVSRNLVRAPEDCVCLYNAIEIDDAVVSNCIVDSSFPESILLVPNDQRAQELLSNRQYVPQNCSQGVTIKGDRYYPDPNYRTYGSQYHRAKYLQVDTKEYMQQLEQSIETFKRKRQAINNQLNAFISDVREQVAKKNQLEEKIRKINQARVQIRRQLEELNSSAEPEVQNVQYLEQELEEVKKVLNDKKASLGQVSEDLKQIKLKIVEKEQEMNQLKESTKGFEDRVQALQEEIREYQTKQKEVSTSDEFDKRKIKEYERRVNEARAEMVLRQNALIRYEEEATSVGERLPDLRTVVDITNDINQIKHKIQRIETDSENATEVMDRYNELSAKYTQSKDIMQSLHKDVQELITAMERRNRHYKLTENHFIDIIKHSFRKILEARQFEGTIEINMREKKLELIVIPQHGSQGLTTTSNLSGGERSFSTVAFLYSLWHCMEFPFYFLDEFDVYMDKLNRTKVIDILLHHAKSKPELQFVFLTPQDVSFINKDVSILRLQDPERFNM